MVCRFLLLLKHITSIWRKAPPDERDASGVKIPDSRAVARLEAYKHVLKSFADFTSQSQSAEVLVISSAASRLADIERSLQPDSSKPTLIEDLKKQLLREFEQRFSWVTERATEAGATNMLLQAAALDPRYGNLRFIEDVEHRQEVRYSHG